MDRWILTALAILTIGEPARGQVPALFNLAGKAFTGNPCAGKTINQACAGTTAIYAGSLDGVVYMIDPSASATVKVWTPVSASDADIAGLINVFFYNAKSYQSGETSTSLFVSYYSAYSNSAAHYCSDLNSGGFTDWYLPSKSELAYLYCKSAVTGHTATLPQEDPNCAAYGGKTSDLTVINTAHEVWSSSEYSDANAWYQTFNGAGQLHTLKGNSKRAYCIRRMNPVLNASPSAVSNLDVTAPATSSGYQTVTIQNTGNLFATQLTTSISGTDLEIGTNNCAGATLAPNATCTVQVRANNVNADGRLEGYLTVAANNVSGLKIPLSGTASATGPCDGTAVGAACTATTALYAFSRDYGGTEGVRKIMVTPGRCTNSATPTCNGGTDNVTKTWGASGTNTGSYDRYDGEAATAFLASTYGDTNAAKFCADMTYGGYSDWYLPSDEEMAILYGLTGSIAGFATGGGTHEYWTSVETSSTQAYYVDFAVGSGSIGTTKTTAFLVRCIRKVRNTW